MVNEGLINTIERYSPKEVAQAIIHAFKNKDIKKIEKGLEEYIREYSK